MSDASDGRKIGDRPPQAFGEVGIYDRRIHEAVCAAGLAPSAMTMHLVGEVYDHGAVIATREVPVAPGESAESWEARVRALEPAVFTEIVARVVAGTLTWPGPGARR